ncbi:MAG: FAD-dependent oxidoreductase, partial [Alphaproteobacteria bacterium]|nr:FAD-dependent oxidoreductase [Alphaproteobacteria bacterium]
MRPDISELDGKRFDVVVIGGGINGASVAQHLAAAGYSLLVVDKGDFGSGASARSSRLLHCGLRYLAPGRSLFDFVRHPSRLTTALRMARLAMEARNEFVRTSAARATPIALHFPIYRDGLYGGWQVDAAFALLRRLGSADVPLDYRRLSPDAARAHPLLGQLRDLHRLAGVAAFREYQFDWPERVCVDAVLDAERLGATARNYTQARLRQRDLQRGWIVELTDMLDESEPACVHGALVLVMSGLWMDALLRDASPTARRKVFGTKGCHLVVQLPEGCAGSGIATFNSRNEPLYCLPWRDLHFVGPTETVYEGDPDRISVSREEADDLLTEANRLLPGLRLTPADVRMSWAGVRPLTYDPDVPFGNRSRVIHDLAQDGVPDALALTAGPVMTHRSAAREMTRL